MTTPRDRVQFTRESAERIADVVRTVELAPTQGRPLTFDAIPPQSPSVGIRFAYYTATSNWLAVSFTSATTTANTKRIQFAFPTNGTATAMCTNHLAYLPLISTNATNAVAYVVVAKEAGKWRLIGAQM